MDKPVKLSNYTNLETGYDKLENHFRAIDKDISNLVESQQGTYTGVATLSAGVVEVSTKNVLANSRIFLTGQDINVGGSLSITARTSGKSFTITSSDITDTGVVAWTLTN